MLILYPIDNTLSKCKPSKLCESTKSQALSTKQIRITKIPMLQTVSNLSTHQKTTGLPVPARLRSASPLRSWRAGGDEWWSSVRDVRPVFARRGSPAWRPEGAFNWNHSFSSGAPFFWVLNLFREFEFCALGLFGISIFEFSAFSLRDCLSLTEQL